MVFQFLYCVFLNPLSILYLTPAPPPHALVHPQSIYRFFLNNQTPILAVPPSIPTSLVYCKHFNLLCGLPLHLPIHPPHCVCCCCSCFQLLLPPTLYGDHVPLLRTKSEPFLHLCVLWTVPTRPLQFCSSTHKHPLTIHSLSIESVVPWPSHLCIWCSMEEYKKSLLITEPLSSIQLRTAVDSAASLWKHHPSLPPLLQSL